MHIIVGLGNPGQEYERTRHNAGFMAVTDYAEANHFPSFVESGKYNALIAKKTVGKEDVLCLLPQTFMNKSGSSLKSLVTSTKKAEKLIVVYDDIDLPLGTMKVSFGRGSGGHRGVESIIRAVKTKDFVRIRIGVTPTTPGGKLKKPKGGEAVQDFLLGDFKKDEYEVLKKVFSRATEALAVTIEEGRVRAMNTCN